MGFLLICRTKRSIDYIFYFFSCKSRQNRNARLVYTSIIFKMSECRFNVYFFGSLRELCVRNPLSYKKPNQGFKHKRESPPQVVFYFLPHLRPHLPRNM